MQQVVRDRLLRQVDEMVKPFGPKDFDDAMRQVRCKVERVMQLLSLMQTREHFSKLLDTLPDPPSLEEKLFVTACRNLPAIIRWVSNLVVTIINDQMPQVPRGRPGIDLRRKADIVEYVGKLHTDGSRLEISKKRAALRYGISEATVQRIWDDRGTVEGSDVWSAARWLTEG